MKKLLCTAMMLFLCTYSSYVRADSVWGSTNASAQTTQIRIGVDISAAGIPSFFSLIPSIATGVFFNNSGEFVNDTGFVYDSIGNDLSVSGNMEATDYCDEAGANCFDPVNVLENVVEDTTPQLGGDLDGQSFKIGLGTTTPDHALQITGNTLATSRSKMVGIGRAAGLALLRVNNTEASPTAITSGNKIGLILFQGHDGTVDTDSGARITSVATENWTASAHGAKLQFRTVDNTTTSVDTRMTIDENGQIGIGTENPNQLLTIENSISLKEIGAANSDTAAYGQIWIKNTAPNQLFFTDDAGTDFQISDINIAKINVAQEYTQQQNFNATTLTALGADLVTNGDFASDTNWTKGTGWTIASGVANSDATQSADSDLTENTLVLVSGNTYEVTFTVTNYVAGNVTAVAGGTEGTDRAANGTFTENIVSAGADLDIRADLDFDGDIDNVIVKLANVSWNLDTNQVTTLTLDGDLVLNNPTNQVDGSTYIIRPRQDGTGTRLLTYGSVYKFPGGTAPTLTTAASAKDIITCISDGTNMECVFQGDFK